MGFFSSIAHGASHLAGSAIHAGSSALGSAGHFAGRVGSESYDTLGSFAGRVGNSAFSAGKDTFGRTTSLVSGAVSGATHVTARAPIPAPFRRYIHNIEPYIPIPPARAVVATLSPSKPTAATPPAPPVVVQPMPAPPRAVEVKASAPPADNTQTMIIVGVVGLAAVLLLMR